MEYEARFYGGIVMSLRKKNIIQPTTDKPSYLTNLHIPHIRHTLYPRYGGLSIEKIIKNQEKDVKVWKYLNKLNKTLKCFVFLNKGIYATF